MSITSDKKVKIFNIVNIIHDFENDQMQKLAIDLSLYFSNKKIFWIFKEKELPQKKITESIINISQEKNYLNIVFLKENIEKKKIEFIKKIMKNFGKKIILITRDNLKNPKDESIFYCRFNSSNKDLKKKIVDIINKI
tara:strand:- start:31 stop:444 length:414 start_codon:yes stop_codon:yes gene_type:complete